MEDKELINNISLTTLWEAGQLNGRGSLYGNECIVYLSGKELEVPNLFKFPCRINAFVLVICLEGSMSFICNLERCKLEKNMIFSCRPGMVVQGEHSEGCRLAIIVLDSDFVTTLNIDGRKMIPYYKLRQKSSTIPVSESDCQELEKLCATVAMHIKNDRSNAFYEDLVKSSISLVFYKMMYVFSAICSHLVEDEGTSTQSEQHFKTFIMLLSKNFRSERSVGFYASHMHVSPKYLSMLIKKVSGKSAAVWIDEFVIQEAKNLLKFSGMNIQEVAYRLNFANQSFFGQYFKKHTGLSPKQYKMQR